MTYTALLALAILRDDFSQLDRQGLIGLLRATQRADGRYVLPSILPFPFVTATHKLHLISINVLHVQPYIAFLSHPQSRTHSQNTITTTERGRICRKAQLHRNPRPRRSGHPNGIHCLRHQRHARRLVRYRRPPRAQLREAVYDL